MFVLPHLPSPQADVHELADFAELICLERGSASAREIVAYLGRLDDNDNNVGCNDDDDENVEALDETMDEIDRRARACGSGYPFILELDGAALRHDEASDADPKAIIYRCLLLSTRLNMKDSRIHDGLDAANLLEELASHVLRNYLGPARAKAFVFGTSVGGKFQDRVESMCQQLCEGSGFRSLDNASIEANDDKLDAVAWVPFADCMPGQVIMFGQCKTGTTWGGLVDQLQPENFIKKWMREPILVDPIRAFCIAEAADRIRWKSTCVSSGILLDRCRLVDFSDNADPGLVSRMAQWTTAARLTIDVAGATSKPKKRSSKAPKRASKRALPVQRPRPPGPARLLEIESFSQDEDEADES